VKNIWPLKINNKIKLHIWHECYLHCKIKKNGLTHIIDNMLDKRLQI